MRTVDWFEMELGLCWYSFQIFVVGYPKYRWNSVCLRIVNLSGGVNNKIDVISDEDNGTTGSNNLNEDESCDIELSWSIESWWN